MTLDILRAEPSVPGQLVEPPEIAYVLSSFYGLGHSSRAVAIAQALRPAQPLALIAREPAHDFLRSNLVDYEGPTSYIPPDYEKVTPDEEYVARNRHLSDVLSNAGVVVNDFHMQMPGLRELMAKADVAPPFVGVYHSISGYESEDSEVKRFKEQFFQLAGNLDLLFLAESKPDHDKPYQLDSGTLVVPCAPIVRQPTVDSAEVKRRYGMEPNEEFIYVQGGGLISGSELEDVARSLKSVSLNGLKVVIALKNAKGMPVSDEDIIYAQPTTDGHNVIAASAGVITKPGMGTMAEAIAFRRPLMLVDYPTPEARAKYDMMRQILGSDLTFQLHATRPLVPQLGMWLGQSVEIQRKFAEVPCDGAQTVASALNPISQTALK